MQTVKPNKRNFPAWPGRLVLGLMITALSWPAPSWGQASREFPWN
jgi:hypothetical protein